MASVLTDLRLKNRARRDRKRGAGRAPTDAALAGSWPSAVAVENPARRARAVRVRSERMIGRLDAHFYWMLALSWVLVNVVFWSWWLGLPRSGVSWLYYVFTAALAYVMTFLPTMYLFYTGQMRRPLPIEAAPGLRVALITLCVPSQESHEVIFRQLEALTRVRYKHDSWVLDEGNDPVVREAAARLGVRYFTRAGIERYNQAVPPFKAKTKAGNVNAWLDAHGADYDFFVQFDIDHRPRPDYLDRVLGYFQDAEVAWVQAPSLYGNLDNWVSRGAAEQELVLQGPLQQGFYGASETPFIIGSHCTYRTRAVLKIGGFQPTRAEDHLDTLMLSAHGYRGVFVPEAIAVGNGPDTFETYLRQQFAWAYSMMQILFYHAPTLIWRCRPKPAAQFVFAQTWYTLWSTSMLLLFAMPLIVLATGHRGWDADLFPFALRSAAIDLVAFATWRWTRRWQLPAGLGLSWRGVVLHIARWPIVLWALINVLLRVKHPYMITPKRDGQDLPRFSLLSQSIYLAAVALTLGVVWLYGLGEGNPDVQGYVLFALLGAGYMLAVVGTNVVADASALLRRGIGMLGLVRLRAAPLAVFLTTFAVLGLTAGVSSPRVVEAATWRDPALARASHERQAATAEEITPAEPASMAVFAAIEAPGATPPEASRVGEFPPRELRAVSGRDAVTLPLDLPADRVAFGAYDPARRFADLPLDVEHSFIRDDQPDLFAEALRAARNRRTVLITLEAAPSPAGTSATLFEIVEGRRDEPLRRLARSVAVAAPQVVVMRWGHEMDLAGLYDWSVGDTALYRAAYRHVVDVFRAEGATNTRWVWSPAGSDRALDYYPGDDVVDYVGLTILGDATWDSYYRLPPQPFEDLFVPKYEVVKGLGKPLILAELGVSGTAERQEKWLAEATRVLEGYPQVRAVIYFEAVNAPNNRLSHLPDWRVAPDLAGRFAAELLSGAASR